MDFKKGILSSAIAVVIYGSVYSAPLIAADVGSSGQTITADETFAPASDAEDCYPDGTNDGCVDAALSAGQNGDIGSVAGDIVNYGTINGGDDKKIVGLSVRDTTGNIINKTGGTINGFAGVDAGHTGSIINESGATISGGTGIIIDINGELGINDPDDSNADFVAISNAGTIISTGVVSDEVGMDATNWSAIAIMDQVEGSIVNEEGGQIISENGHGILFMDDDDDDEGSSDTPDTPEDLLERDLVNAGTIQGKLTGINIEFGAIDGEIRNTSTGKILSEQIAIDISSKDTSNVVEKIVNEGLIQGYIGILVDDNNVATSAIEDTSESILNSGTIRAVGADGLLEVEDEGDDVLSHAIYAETGEVVGVINDELGTIDGRLFGDNLSLNNSGTLKTLSGSDIKSYVGNGTIIAVLDDKIVAIGETLVAENNEFGSVL
nr:hypothetical protein [Endozoicomonas sp.]